jgi:hypothetical protein
VLVRFYLKLIPIFVLIFIALSLTARVLGTTQPPNPALRGFTEDCEDKPQPCWYGIVPGVTTVEEAKTILTLHNYWERPDYLLYDEGYEYVNISEAPSCVTLVRYVGDTIISGLTLGCLGIRLGDVISHWGTPRVLGYDERRNLVGLGYIDYAVSLHRSNFQPHLWMYAMFLYTLPKYPNSQPSGGFRWQGFAPFWEYCQTNYIPFLCPRRASVTPISTAAPINSNAPTLPPPPPLATLPPR